MDCILDSEGMQVELVLKDLEVVWLWIDDVEPDDRAFLLEHLADVFQVGDASGRLPVAVDLTFRLPPRIWLCEGRIWLDDWRRHEYLDRWTVWL
jgi:hypothetical protein